MVWGCAIPTPTTLREEHPQGQESESPSAAHCLLLPTARLAHPRLGPWTRGCFLNALQDMWWRGRLWC